MNYLSICCIIKNENRYLEEWIRFHQLIGVERFLICDNESDPPADEVLAPFVAGGIVQLLKVQGSPAQIPLYDYVAKNSSGNTRWLAFIDADEFLVPAKHDDLRTLLADYESFGGLGVNWLTFGSSGHVNAPPGLTIENFRNRSEKSAPVNRHIKSIVQTDKVASTGGSPHHFFYKPGHFCVNERKIAVPSAYSDHSSELVQLNHYFTRSLEEFKAKIARRRADTGQEYPLSTFFEYDAYCNAVEDTTALRFLPKLSGR